jgi:thymidine kinase
MVQLNITQNMAYLEVILGCMYSGKTTRLINVYDKCKISNIPVVSINHSIDVRYDDRLMSTHDKRKIPCIKSNNYLMNLMESEHIDEIENAKVILINEGQFFCDLKEFVELMLSKFKKVYVCGLDGDFKREKFGQILDIIPLCDTVRKLTSLCSICCDGTPAIFSKRITNEEEQTVVGSDNYIPVCRNCFNK